MNIIVVPVLLLFLLRERGTRLPLLRLPLSSLLFLWIWMRLHVDDDLARKEFSCSYICDKTYLLPTYSSPKVEKTKGDSLYSMPSRSPSVRIQIIGGKVYLR